MSRSKSGHRQGAGTQVPSERLVVSAKSSCIFLTGLTANQKPGSYLCIYTLSGVYIYIYIYTLSGPLHVPSKVKLRDFQAGHRFSKRFQPREPSIFVVSRFRV